MFHSFNDLNRFPFWCSKKKKSLGYSDDRAYQIAGRNDDNTLEILRAKPRAETYVHNMFIIQGRKEQQRVCKFLFLIGTFVKTNSNLMCGSL